MSSSRLGNRIDRSTWWKRRLARKWPEAYAFFRMADLKVRVYKNLAHPFSFIDVNPQQVETVVADELYWWYFEEAGQVVDGDWDTNSRSLTGHWKYIDLHDRFVRGMPWTQSEHFKRLVLRGHTEMAAVEKLKYYDRLRDSIDTDGFKMSVDNDTAFFGEDICVCIDREGKILFSGSGWHRLSISRVLRLPSIPVRVIWRHHCWQVKRDAGASLDHPDLGGSS